MVMQTFNFSIYHTCKIYKHLAIHCLVPGVPLEFQSDLVINQYRPNTCKQLIAMAVTPRTWGMTEIVGQIMWKMEKQKTLCWPAVLSWIRALGDEL